MSVVIETTLGDVTVDLFLSERPRACLNFLKLCKIKYYNFNLFHTISRSFIAQTGDPTGSRSGGDSIFGVLDGPSKRYFEAENEPRIKHTKMGLISFVGNEERMIGSQFFLTLGEDLTYLDEKHCVFGEVVEGFEILEMINEVICDTDDRPYQDVRITHTVILDDPYPNPKRLVVPSRSPSPSAERLQGGRIAPDEEIDETEGKPAEEIAEIQAEKEAKARATILEMVGDLPDADMAPPENVLFVCKLNPVTSDDDLEIIFSRFGKIKSCEVIRDKKTGDSLQYAFVEFEDQKSCENAYFKMDNVLIDDRRIHVDFSQSVSKIKWHGKGRGVTHYDDKGKKSKDNNNDIGKGNYRNRGHANYKKEETRDNDKSPKRIRNRSKSPRRQNSSRNIRDNSPSPSRAKNRSRYGRDSVPFKKRNKDIISPERSSRLRNHSREETYKNRGRYEERSRRHNNKPMSPKMNDRSPTPRKNRYIAKSPRRSRDRSRSPKYKSRDSKTKSTTPSTTPKRSRDITPLPKNRHSRSKSPHKNNYYLNETSKYKTVPSSSTKYSSDRKSSIYNSQIASKDERKIKGQTRSSHHESEIEPKKKEKTKKHKYSSEDSDSDSDKKSKKVKKHSTSSSDSEDYQKKKLKKKKHGKRSKNSSSDSEDSENYKKSKTKKKKKKKYESESD